MSIRVTLNVYSGRENPSWILTDNQANEFSRKVAGVSGKTFEKPLGVLAPLGFRGFTLSQPGTAAGGFLNMYVHGGIIDRGQEEQNLLTGDRELEKWLLQTAPNTVSAAVRNHVSDELQRAALSAQDYAARQIAAVACPACVAHDAPAYNPSAWNIPTVQPYNNCYNYANDHATNTFAQPGNAHGAPAATMSCADVNAAARADSLRDTVGFTAPLSAGKGWYVALVIWPGQDYHWYRQDKIGCWSHKPGHTPVRDVDNGGNRISDPRTCDRGPYTDFCGYMITDRTVVIR